MKRRTKVILAVLGLLVVALGVVGFRLRNQLPGVIEYVRQAEIPIEGEVQKVVITGTGGSERTFFVYLPPGYENSDERYKTLYHLHGAFVREDWAGYDCNGIGAQIESAVAAGIIEPMIIVCPWDPEGDSMWSDSYDGQYTMWTGFTQDIIPYIDANYRTIPERGGRALQGFSMGGFGATMNALRSPELFAALIVWDGALHNWETLTSTRESIATKMFASEDYFMQWSPWELTSNASDVEMDMFLVAGNMAAVRDFNERFWGYLEDEGRDFVHYDANCPHSVFCLMDQYGEEAFTFLANSFAQQ
ncbi:MAG: hypothetical protein DWQ07_25400 [Chloroflexi bacterium]|nr:MAG: hypothetical protein DWQ07_25400 [Chloroflexota bacterium]MBL1196127.1 hypothetical protein [Chloroflexota bacterium]NOH13420.1 hypothetical protein [Chloroflexota bacterium]